MCHNKSYPGLYYFTERVGEVEMSSLLPPYAVNVWTSFLSEKCCDNVCQKTMYYVYHVYHSRVFPSIYRYSMLAIFSLLYVDRIFLCAKISCIMCIMCIIR